MQTVNKYFLWVPLVISQAVCASDAITSSFELGLEGYRETYKETVDNAPFMQEKAGMAGINAGVTFNFYDKHALKIQGRYAEGESDYTGAYQGDPYGSLTINGIDRRAGEIRAQYQYIGCQIAGIPLMPSVGLGRRQLVDKLEQAGSGGYRRKNTLNFATVGLESSFKLGAGWALNPKAGYNYVLNGTQRSGTFLENKQNSGHGFEFAVEAEKKLSDNMAMKISPFYRYWHIAKSDEVFSAYEPKNTTKEVGLSVSMLFK